MMALTALLLIGAYTTFHAVVQPAVRYVPLNERVQTMIEQLPGAGLDPRHLLARLLADRLGDAHVQQIGVADDGVQRRA